MSTEESVTGVSLPSGIDRDLENARVLLEDPPWIDNPQKYRKRAEAILRRILAVDPGNPMAKMLLAKAEVRVPDALPAMPPPVFRSEPEEVSFVIPAAEPKSERVGTKSPMRGVIGFIAATVFAGFLVFGFLSSRIKSEAGSESGSKAAPAVLPATPVSPQPINDVSSPAPDLLAAASTTYPAVTMASTPLSTPPSVFSTATPAATPPPTTTPSKPVPPPAPEAKATEREAAPVATGSLAVSSPTTVDIFNGDQFLGSAPITLELPAGNLQLEYRHQDMRRVITHQIKANEAAAVMVTFDVPVQINARPWAQVFIQGSQRQALGQTPLSNVRVPIGSLLVFENPNFPGKSYRVTGKETEIRINFP